MARIFINYRRGDTIATAGRLHDRLAAAFGRQNLFMDVDHIPAGVDFAAHLNAQVGALQEIVQQLQKVISGTAAGPKQPVVAAVHPEAKAATPKPPKPSAAARAARSSWPWVVP